MFSASATKSLITTKNYAIVNETKTWVKRKRVTFSLGLLLMPSAQRNEAETEQF